MTEDAASSTQPGALHPDHHALVVNPLELAAVLRPRRRRREPLERRVRRTIPPTAPRRRSRTPVRGWRSARCVLSRVPERLDGDQPWPAHARTSTRSSTTGTTPTASPAAPRTTARGRRSGDQDTWMNVNVADGGHNSFDAPGGDTEFALTGFQAASSSVRYNPLQAGRRELDRGHAVSVTFYANEASPFIGQRDHRSGHAGRDLDGPRARVPLDELGPQPGAAQGGSTGSTAASGSATATSTRTARYEPPADTCDDFKPLGDPARTAG